MAIISWTKKMTGTVVFKNMTSLAILQIANYMIPLLIIPYVTRALGLNNFGAVSYAQNVVAYFILIVNYGFEYSATKDIAIHRDNKEALTQIFWSVIRFKLLFCLLSILAITALCAFWEPLQHNFKLYLSTSLILVGYALFPSWFFQGIERMAKLAYINFAIKLGGAILIFVFIKEYSDYWIYPLLLSLSYIMGGVWALGYCIKTYGLRNPTNTETNKKNSTLINGLPIFLNLFLCSLYSMIGTTILGDMYSDTEVGLYSGASRIISAAMMIVSASINMALFPMMSRAFHENFEKGWSLFKRSVIYIGLITALISLVIYLAAPLCVYILLGNEFTEAIPLVRIMSPLPCLVSLSSLLMVQGIYAMGKQRIAPFIGLCIGLSSVILNWSWISQSGMRGASYSWVTSNLAEIFLSTCIIIILRIKQKKLTEQT